MVDHASGLWLLDMQLVVARSRDVGGVTRARSMGWGTRAGAGFHKICEKKVAMEYKQYFKLTNGPPPT